MKKPKGFEQFILLQALEYYKGLTEQDEYPRNSFVTKEYVLSVIADLQEMFKEK